jgi:hypothetical protein
MGIWDPQAFPHAVMGMIHATKTASKKKLKKGIEMIPPASSWGRCA